MLSSSWFNAVVACCSLDGWWSEKKPSWLVARRHTRRWDSGGSTQGTDRRCWLRERFSGSSAGRPWPLSCVGEQLLRGWLCCGRQKTSSSVVCRGAVLAGRLWCRPGEGGQWVDYCPVAEGEEDLPGWREKKLKIKNPQSRGFSRFSFSREGGGRSGAREKKEVSCFGCCRGERRWRRCWKWLWGRESGGVLCSLVRFAKVSGK